jgi:hypothetical protein
MGGRRRGLRRGGLGYHCRGLGPRCRAARAGGTGTCAHGGRAAAAGCRAPKLRHSRSPPPRHGQGKGGRAQGGGGEREGLRREERSIRLKSMEEAHRGRRPSSEPKPNPSIAGDSEIQSTKPTRPDEALDETNVAVPSESADDAQIGSNCSSELSSKLEPPRTLASNTES